MKSTIVNKIILFIIFIIIICVLCFVYGICVFFMKKYQYSFFQYKKLFDIHSYPLPPLVSKKIVIITFENRPLLLNKYHNRSFTRYATKYDYKYIFLNQYKSDLPIYWWKIQIVLDYLQTNQDFDYIVWADSDIMVCIDLPIEWIISHTSLPFLVSLDNNDIKNNKNAYNAGFFILKRCDLSIEFLQSCINHFIENSKCKDKNNNYQLNSEWAGICYEQGVMNYFLNSSYQSHCYPIPKTMVRSHNQFVNDVIFMHYTNRFKKEEIALTFSIFLKLEQKKFINIMKFNPSINLDTIYFWNNKSRWKPKSKTSYVILYFTKNIQKKDIFYYLPSYYMTIIVFCQHNNFIGLPLYIFKRYKKLYSTKNLSFDTVVFFLQSYFSSISVEYFY